MPHIMVFMILDPEPQHKLFNHLVQTPHLTVTGGQVVAPDSDPGPCYFHGSSASLVNWEYYFLAFNSPFYAFLFKASSSLFLSSFFFQDF